MAWKPGRDFSPLSCQGAPLAPVFLSTNLSSAPSVTALRWEVGEDTEHHEERQKGQLGSAAPNPSPARGNLLPAHPQWNTVITITRLPSRHSFSSDLKTPKTKNNNKKDQKKNFFELSKTIKLQTDTKPEAFQSKSRCLKSSACTSKWGLESPEGTNYLYKGITLKRELTSLSRDNPQVKLTYNDEYDSLETVFEMTRAVSASHRIKWVSTSTEERLPPS